MSEGRNTWQAAAKAMNSDDLNHSEAAGLTDWIVVLFDLAYAERFRPFTVVMSDNRRYPVPTRDHVAIGYDASHEPDHGFYVLGDDDSEPRLSLFSILAIELT